MDKVALIQEGMRRWREGDEQGMLELFHPDVEVWATDETLNSGTYQGREGMQRWYRQWNEAWDSIEYDPLEFIEVSESLLVVPIRITATARGAQVSQEMAWLFEVGDEDLCMRWELHADKDAALASARVWLAGQHR